MQVSIKYKKDKWHWHFVCTLRTSLTNQVSTGDNCKFYLTKLLLLWPSDADLDGKELTVINASNILDVSMAHVVSRTSATAKKVGVVFFVTKVITLEPQNERRYLRINTQIHSK